MDAFLSKRDDCLVIITRIDNNQLARRDRLSEDRRQAVLQEIRPIARCDNNVVGWEVWYDH